MTDSQPHYFLPSWPRTMNRIFHVDLCVYGGTAAGITAAIASARLGRRVIILNPSCHVGGMTTGGLGWTDFGRKGAIGGLARELYRQIGKIHREAEMWRFWPQDAARVFRRWLDDADVPVYHRQFLDRVEMDGRRIRAARMLGGLEVHARTFVDATYEGDLLAKAGVSYVVGREGNAVYKESLNGVQIRQYHQFSHPVDPHVEAGNPASGLLPHVGSENLFARIGQGDRCIQAYCFRVCMTDDPSLKIDWVKPAGYDPSEYTLAARWFAGEKDTENDPFQVANGPPREIPKKIDILPRKTPNGYHKTDSNNHGPVSSDFIGANHAWPEADYETRERIFQKHVSYQKGLYWFLANDPCVPPVYRDAYARWGLPKDEFEDTGNWPHQLGKIKGTGAYIG